jgi:nucleotide-binding universal stress UspA family protein
VHRDSIDLPQHVATIGVGYNGSSRSIEALAFGCQLAAALGAKVRVLEVVCPPRAFHVARSGAELGRDVDLLLCRARERLAELNLDGVDGCAVYGIVEEELTAFAEEVDLLVIGLGSQEGCRPRLSADAGTWEYLRCNAHCPVLVVPRPSLAMTRPRSRAAWANSRARKRRAECCIG